MCQTVDFLPLNVDLPYVVIFSATQHHTQMRQKVSKGYTEICYFFFIWQANKYFPPPHPPNSDLNQVFVAVTMSETFIALV